MPGDYKPVNLPARTREKLRRLKIAHSYSSGRIPSYAEVIEILIDSLERTNPGLYNTYINITGTGQAGAR